MSTLTSVMDSVGRHPQRTLWLLVAASVGLLAFGILYLQNVVGLEPCPMCIVQRYALILVALIAGVSATVVGPKGRSKGIAAMGAMSLFGAFVAARQSFLQWYPPEVLSCGRDLYGMIESFPLKRAIPMIFKGSGDCSAVDWSFLGLTIANWSFLCFVGIAAIAALLLLRSRKTAK